MSQMNDLEDLFYHFNDEVAVRQLREDLLKFGIGLQVHRRFSSHKINIFPTRRYDIQNHKGIWEIELELTCFIGQMDSSKIMWPLLTQEEFEQWNSEQWEPWLRFQQKRNPK
jgi:hypothetical protein